MPACSGVMRFICSIAICIISGLNMVAEGGTRRAPKTDVSPFELPGFAWQCEKLDLYDLSALGYDLLL